MGQLKQSSTAGGGLVWTQTNLPLTPQETTLLYKGMEVVDNTNNQTVGGNKTFTGTVKINNAPVATTDGVNKAYADSLSAQAVKSVTGTDPIVATSGKTPVISIKDATPTQKGSMSAADKAKLDGHPTLVVNKAGDTMTGSLTTTANLYADGSVLSKTQVISTDSTNTYTTRIAVVGSIGYFQSGATNRDITDQKMILTGWQGTPLSMSKFTMANGVNPQVQWGSTNYDILHRGNMPTVTDLNAVSKSGDTIAHLTINNNGYFKQNYGLESGYKIAKQIGSITDAKAGLIVLGQIITTNQNPEGFAGTISIQRGSSSTNIITTIVDLVAKKAYNLMDARIVSTTSPRVGGGRLCKITHEGKDYIAYYSPSASGRNVVVDGISWGIEPFLISDATGYVLSDLISSTDTIRTDTNDYMLNNNSNERVPSWGVSEGQGFVMHGKTAIGGANDGWLRLNPFDAFTTGIYTGNGIIRHGGTSIQLGSLGDAQATTLYRPNDVAWSLTTGGYAAVSVKQQTSSSAHWLLGSYKSSFEGDMRAGIQVLSNDTGTMRIYTNMRTHYAEISNGNILVSGAQSSSGSSLTKKDYVDSQDALKVNKAGDTMTGNLTVNANINAFAIGSTGAIMANTTSTKSGIRLGSDSIGYSEIVPRRANEAGYLWSDSIRYYDSYNYWAIGVDRIHTDTYAPRLTSIANSLDLNTISVPVKTMSLAHFGSAATNKPNTSNSANSVVHISTWETGAYAHQLAFSSDGKIYNRYNNNVSWSDWGQVYTSIYKPTPADVGAVNKTGDTMTGVLGVTRINHVNLPSANQQLINADNTGMVFVGNEQTVNDLRLQTNNGVASVTIGDTSFRIYHAGFKPTAIDVNAVGRSSVGSSSVNLNGLRTSQHLRLEAAGNITNRPSDDVSYAQMIHVNGGGDTHMQILGTYNTGKLFWRGFNNTMAAGSVSWYQIYHTGFKPTADDVGAAPSGYGLGVNAPLIHDRSGFFANDAPSVAGYPGSGAGFQSTYGSNRRAQIYMNSSGAVYSRFSLVGNVIDTSTPWATHYTTLNKPTSADIGAVNKTGDTMTGRVSIEGRNSPGAFGVKRINSTQFANYGQSGDTGGEAIVGVGPSTEHFDSYLKVGVNKLTFQGGSGEKKVYHEGFKPTASDVGATPSGYGVGEAAALKPDANALPNVGGIFAAAGAGSLNYANQYSTIIQAFRPGGADASGQVLQIQELDGSIAVRNRNGGYWTSWNKLYGERNRPTPGDVGAVNKTGDTMTGLLTLSSSTSGTQGQSTGTTFGAMYNARVPHLVTSNTSGSSYSPAIAAKYVHNGGWTGVYSAGVRNTDTANAGQFCIHHINDGGTQEMLWMFGGATGDFTAPGVLYTGSGQGGAANSLTRKDYVDTEVSRKMGSYGDQVLAGNLTISTAAPVITLQETDTTKRFLLVVDGAGARFQADGTSGSIAWSVNSDGIITLNSPNTSTSQGTNPGSLTRKDYVDGRVDTRAPNGHLHTAADANSNIVAGAQYAVGSYILAQKLTSSANGYGDNILGSSLIPASAGNRYWDGHSLPGTWKCMGYAADTGQEVDQRTTLFIRIS